MSFLVDTCALSELLRPRPSPRVTEWFLATPQTTLFVSVLTLGEIRKGVAMLGKGRSWAQLTAWLETELSAWAEDRILPIDAGVADTWGRLVAQTPSIPAIDSLIAATALHHRLAVVTRNETDFADTGVEVVNPWEGWG
ncbi:MAG: Toxin FitB [Verrucomicrobia subdivision 3 bacterium]|nr:Toxin FitB [Limisphaerales bacterium]